jgi:hypothetical protein
MLHRNSWREAKPEKGSRSPTVFDDPGKTAHFLR